jgi:hypothetical protein
MVGPHGDDSGSYREKLNDMATPAIAALVDISPDDPFRL